MSESKISNKISQTKHDYRARKIFSPSDDAIFPMTQRIRTYWRQRNIRIEFCDPLVKITVESNQAKFEPYGQAVDEALDYIQNNPQYSLYGEKFNAFAEQDSPEIKEFSKTIDSSDSENEDLNDICMPLEKMIETVSLLCLLPIAHQKSLIQIFLPW